MSLEQHSEFRDAASDSHPEQFVCRECGHVHRAIVLAPGETARCVRCNTVLAKKGWFGRDGALAFTLTGLLLILPSILLPFITVRKLGGEQVTMLFTGVGALWGDGMHLLSVWVLVCGGAAPVILLLSLAGVLVAQRLGWKSIITPRLLRVARAVAYWSIPEVQMLAVLVALAKLGAVVHVVLGPGFWCYAALAVVTILAWRSFILDLPDWSSVPQEQSALSAMRFHEMSPWTGKFSNSAALAVAAAIMLVPANILPVLYTRNAAMIRTDTIFSGIVGLCQRGWWFLGAIVFIASIFIPLLKLAGLGSLLLVSRHGANKHSRPWTRFYVVLGVIGRWSMLDVFLVAFVSGAVQFGILANAEPRPGIGAFAAVVVLTVLATEAFDPHALWHRVPPTTSPPSPP